MRLSKMQVITGLVGVMIVGEALALLVGLGWLSRWQSPWLSWKNLTLLVLDLIAGALSTWCALGKGGAAGRFGHAFSLGVLLLSHAYRGWETLAAAANPFCFNLPLSIVNWVKLAGLLAVLVMTLAG